MAYEVKITAAAEKDLDLILSYLVNELANPQAAGHFLDEIAKVYLLLREQPQCCPVCSQKLLNRYRKVPILRYVMLCRIEENTVYVERYFSHLEDYLHKL